MGVLPVYMTIYHVYPVFWKPKHGIRPPGNRVTDAVSCHTSVRTERRFSVRLVRALNCYFIPPAPGL